MLCASTGGVGMAAEVLQKWSESQVSRCLTWLLPAQVTPSQPVTSFALRLSSDIYNDPRRIIETFPNNGTLTSYDSNGACMHGFHGFSASRPPG